MKAFLIDIAKCNGCFNCQICCKDEHVDNDWSPYAKPEPEVGQFWIKVTEQVRGQVPWVRLAYIPSLCSHCDDAPCAAVCPASAFMRRDDGLLILSPERCQGCGACVEACPTHSIYFNDALSIAQKCTGCAHLLDEGWDMPRCVDSCATEALRFGDEAELADLIAGAEPDPRLSTEGVHVYYRNLPKRFVAGSIIDPVDREVIIGATVELVVQDGVKVAKQLSDEFGDFIFEQVDAAPYRIHITAEGYEPLEVTADVTDEDRSVGDLFLKRCNG